MDLIKNTYTREELMSTGDGGMLGPEYAKLPVDNMLMFDRVVNTDTDSGKYGQGEVVAELDIHPGLWFFDCHFVGDPVMPGCLGLDALWQMLGFHIAWRGHKGKGRALGVKEVRFRGEVLPASKVVEYRLDIKRITAGRLVIGVADGILSVDGKQVYTAKDLKVGIFDPASRQQGGTL